MDWGSDGEIDVEGADEVDGPGLALPEGPDEVDGDDDNEGLIEGTLDG